MERVTYTIRWSRIKTLSRHIKIIGGFQRDVLAKTPGLHQVPKLRNLNFGHFGHVGVVMARTDRVTYTIRWSRIKTLSRHLKIIGGFQRDVLAKTPGLHQVPKL